MGKAGGKKSINLQYKCKRARLTAPKIIQARKDFFPLRREYTAQRQPKNSTQTSQLDCKRRGVKPKQEI